MDLAHRIQFFLGANSAEGLLSLYDQWLDEERMQAYYVLKGGAGCGKSTLMGQVAQRMEEKGYTVEYIRCSGDPDSLDGILIPEKGAAMVDGTAPHRIDPAYTGATGHYIDLGVGYDRNELFPLREKIIHATRAYQACYPLAYHRLRGAAESYRRGCQPLHTEETLARTTAYAAGILSREVPERRGVPGKKTRRLLSGITCQGPILLEDTINRLCKKMNSIQDSCGLGHVLLACLETGFLESGYAVISCPDPLQPRRAAHLLIPELSLGFITDQGQREAYRTVVTEELVDKQLLEKGKSFLRLSNRVAEELLDNGISYLQKAKEEHDALETLYRPHVDFTLSQRFASQTAKEILDLPDIQPEISCPV